jgi:hypothetical protein
MRPLLPVVTLLALALAPALSRSDDPTKGLDGLHKKQVELTAELADLFASIKDKDSAAKAKPRLTALKEELKQIKAASDALKSKYDSESEKADERLRKAEEKAHSIQDVSVVFDDAPPNPTLKNAVVGKWQGELQGITITLEIRKDGTMDYVGFPASWRLDGDNLKITTQREIPGTSTRRFQSRVEIKDEVMTLTDTVGPTKGQTLSLKRVRPTTDKKD